METPSVGQDTCRIGGVLGLLEKRMKCVLEPFGNR